VTVVLQFSGCMTVISVMLSVTVQQRAASDREAFRLDSSGPYMCIFVCMVTSVL